MQTEQQFLPTTCPRCGQPLLRAGVACTRRGCRPVALRPVKLQPVNANSEAKSMLTSILDGAGEEQRQIEPVTPPGVATPPLQKEYGMEERVKE